MDSLVGYGSDDDNETERYGSRHSGSAGGTGGTRRRDDDTNYDDVNMDMSEDSQAESEPELPQAEPHPSRRPHNDRRGSDEGRDREREREYRRRESPPRRLDRSERRSPRKDDRHSKSDRDRGDRGRGYDSSSSGGSSRRGLLGDRPDDRLGDKPPALMDLKPFGEAAPYRSSQDARDAVSPRFVDRTSDRRDRERDRDRGDRDRSERDRGDRERSERDRSRDRSRSRSHPRRSEERHGRRGAAFPPPATVSNSSSSERRHSPPSGDYRPSSYKVNRKLDVIEKMGLQIKTPDGSMATAQQLRTAAGTAPSNSAGAPSYYNNPHSASSRIMEQVQKRKMLWANKGKDEAQEAAKWSGTRFAQDNDGKQVSKFMRLMGIKEPAAVPPAPAEQSADPIKKQEELFQAMQAQYEVARATTHTMRGVGLGFQRGQY